MKDLGPVPYYDPVYGWMFDGRRLSPYEVQDMCRRFKIPYEVPTDSTPDYWEDVLSVDIAGVCFLKNPKVVLSKLQKGCILRMEREDNQYDRNAIVLRNPDGDKVGYIPRKSNATLAALMDLGDEFQAEVVGDPSDVYDVPIVVRMYRGKKTRRHFSVSDDCMAGRIVTVDAAPARRDSWKFKSMSPLRSRLVLRREFSEDDLWNLQWGHTSKSMDDRWNFFQSGRRLYISRSWTGHCIFILELGDGEEHDVLVENSPDIYKSPSPSENLETLNALLDEWLKPVVLSEDCIPNGIYGNVRLVKRSDSCKNKGFRCGKTGEISL